MSPALPVNPCSSDITHPYTDLCVIQLVWARAYSCRGSSREERNEGGVSRQYQTELRHLGPWAGALNSSDCAQPPGFKPLCPRAARASQRLQVLRPARLRPA